MFSVVPNHPNRVLLDAGQERFDKLLEDIVAGNVDGRYVAEKVYRDMVAACSLGLPSQEQLFAEISALAEKCGMVASPGLDANCVAVFVISKDGDWNNALLKMAKLHTGPHSKQENKH